LRSDNDDKDDPSSEDCLNDEDGDDVLLDQNLRIHKKKHIFRLKKYKIQN